MHGFVLFYSSESRLIAKVNTSPMISIQLEIVHASQQNVSADSGEEKSTNSVTSHALADKSKNHQGAGSINVAPRQAEITEMPVQLTSYVKNQEQVSDQANLEDNVRQLLSLVYQEINRKKHYPYLAKRQRREGLVKLSFVLHPDGKVTDVAVIGSSRFSVLDRAAQKAVEDISPFLLAADYLNYQRAFNVDVDFRLGKI